MISRFYWRADPGVWFFDVPMGLPSSVVRKLAADNVPKLIEKFRTLPPGDRKDDLKKAIEALSSFKIVQRIVGARGNSKGDLKLFEAPRPHEARKIISHA